MREQCFAMYLSLLIIIFIEVFSILHRAEGTSVSTIRPKSQGTTGNFMQIDDLDSRVQFRNKRGTETSKRNKRMNNNGKRSNRQVSKNQLSKNQLAKILDVTSDQPVSQNPYDCITGRREGNNPSSEQPCYTDEQDSDSRSFDDTITDINNLMTDETTPQVMPDYDKTDFGDLLNESLLNLRAPTDQPNLILANIISAFTPLFNSNFSSPEFNFQTNNPKLGTDLKNPADSSLMEFVETPPSQQNTPPVDFGSLEKLPQPAGTHILDAMLSVIYQTLRSIIHRLEPSASVAAAVLQIFQSMMNLPSSLLQIAKESGLNQGTDNPPNSLDPILEYLNYKPVNNVEKPSPQGQGSVNLTQMILDSLKSPVPPPTTSANTPFESISNLLNSVSVPNLFKPKQSKWNNLRSKSKTSRKLNKGKRKLKLPRKILQPIGTLIDYFNPLEVIPESTGNKTNILNDIKTVVDYLNVFKPNSDNKKPSSDNPSNVSLNTTVAQGVLDYLINAKPNTDSKLSSSQSTLDISLNSTFIDAISSYLNTMKPNTDQKTPTSQDSLNISLNSELVQSVLEYLNNPKPNNDQKTPSSQSSLNISVSSTIAPFIQSILNFLSAKKPNNENNMSFLIKAVVQYLNSHKLTTNDKIPVFINTFIKYLSSQKPFTDDQVPYIIDSIVRYLISLKPVIVHQTHAKPNVNNGMITAIESVVSYLHSLKTTNIHHKPVPNKSLNASLLTIIKYLLNHLDTLKLSNSRGEPGSSEFLVQFIKSIPNINLSKPMGEQPQVIQSIIAKLKNYRQQNDPAQFSTSYDNPLQSLLLKLNPLGIPGPSEESLQSNDNSDFFYPNSPDNLDEFDSMEDPDSPIDDSQSPYNLPYLNNIRSTRAIRCPKIPSGYYQIGNIQRAYKFHNFNLNWKDAQLKCQSEGGGLALPEDLRQYNNIVEYARKIVKDLDFDFHAGFLRPASEKTWRTIRGDPLPYEKWSNDITGDDILEELCGGILLSNNDAAGFTGGKCTSPLPFMCELTIPPECS